MFWTSKNQPLATALPITIGVIGHRTIAASEVERICKQLKTILETYKHRAPDTPIFLLTALAEGADQIAAEVGLNIDGVTVVAVLPLEPDEYEKDFDSPAKIVTFYELLGRCHLTIQANEFYDHLSAATLAPEIIAALAPTSVARTHAYRDCARLISHQSHLLVAIWDGETSILPGGTSDTITHRLKASKQIPTKIVLEHSWPQVHGLLLHIHADRSDEATTLAGSPSTAKREIQVLTADQIPRPWLPHGHDIALENFQFINSRVLQSKPNPASLPLLTDSVMAVADTQSARLQRGFKRQVASLLLLGILGLFMIDLQRDFESPYPFLSSVLILAITGVIWFRFLQGTLRDRSYQFRSLAEGLRVQRVWIECDIHRDASDNYLRGIPELHWIPRAMRTSRFIDLIHLKSKDRDDPISDELVSENANRWIESQIQYFAGSATSNGAVEDSRERFKFFDKVSLIGLGIPVLCLLLDGFRFLSKGGPFPHTVVRAEQLTMYLSLSISAASAAYSQLMAFREIGRQYENSLQNFIQGEDILGQSENIEATRRESVQSVVTQIGKEALQETEVWLALKRDRAVNPI